MSFPPRRKLRVEREELRERDFDAQPTLSNLLSQLLLTYWIIAVDSSGTGRLESPAENWKWRV
jgi:hypothetical protein